MITIDIEERILTKKNSKQIFFNRRTGRPFITSKPGYKEFEDRASLLVLNQTGGVKFSGYVEIDYVFFVKGKQRVDKDNMEASVNDILQKAGIILDDNLIIGGNYKKIFNAGRWGVRLKIKEAEPYTMENI